jgi:hypothetical protein
LNLDLVDELQAVVGAARQGLDIQVGWRRGGFLRRS